MIRRWLVALLLLAGAAGASAQGDFVAYYRGLIAGRPLLSTGYVDFHRVEHAYRSRLAAASSGQTADLTWRLPPAYGAAGACVKGDGAGNLAMGTCGDLLAANNLNDVASPSAALVNLGAQPLAGNLTALAGITYAASKCTYWSSSSAAAAFDCSTYGRSLIGSADAAAARASLGLGTLAELNVAPTATALAANGANCSPGTFPLGVDAAGAAESCTAVSTTLSTATPTSGLSASLLATNGSALVQGPTYSSGVFTQAIRFGDASLGSTIVPLVARLGTASTANIMELQNAAGTNLAYFAANGKLHLPVGSAAAPALSLGNFTGYGFYDDGSGSWNFAASSVKWFQFVAQSTMHLGLTRTIGWDTSTTPGSGIATQITSDAAATLQMGIDANGAPVNQIFKAHDGITGTDVAGASLTDAAGRGTGSAVPADRITQTAVPVASGTTAQTLGDRGRILGRYTALAEATATSFARVAIASGTVTGGDVIVTVEANDATDYQSRTLHYSWSASNKAGTLSFGLSTPAEGVGPSTGTLACTITLVDAGSGNLDHKADCTSSLTQTVLRANAQVRKNFGVGAISAQ